MPRLTMPRAAPDNPRPRTNNRPPPDATPSIIPYHKPKRNTRLRNTDTISHPAHRLPWCAAISTVIPPPPAAIPTPPTVIPAPPAVIPACAGIQAVWPYPPSFRLPSRHSGATRNLGVWSYPPSFRLPQPSFRLAPESRPCGHIHRHSSSPNRHSGASRNLCLPAPLQ